MAKRSKNPLRDDKSFMNAVKNEGRRDKASKKRIAKFKSGGGAGGSK